MAALRPTWRRGAERRRQAATSPDPHRQKAGGGGDPAPFPRRDAYRRVGETFHCLDRVWQCAEVHGALLWIRWATGRQQRRIGDGQNSIQWGGRAPGQDSRSTPMSPCPLTPASNSSTCAATRPHYGGRCRIVAVVWTAVPTAPVIDGPAQIELTVRISRQADRANARLVKYHLTVRTLTAHSVNFQARDEVVGWHSSFV